MKISDFLSPADVEVDVRVSNKRQLLLDMSRMAASRLGLDDKEISSALLKREDLGSTGLGGGVAIPHARLPIVKRPFGMLATLRPPIEFDAIDQKPVDIVFLLLLPSLASDQLVTLAAIARKLKSGSVLNQLRTAKSQSDLYKATVADEEFRPA